MKDEGLILELWQPHRGDEFFWLAMPDHELTGRYKRQGTAVVEVEVSRPKRFNPDKETFFVPVGHARLVRIEGDDGVAARACLEATRI